MTNIAIVSSGSLPVPAVKGGGVETLITKIVELNETDKIFKIDLYTKSDILIDDKYNNTNIIQVNFDNKDKIINKIVNVFNKICKKKEIYSTYYNKVSNIIKSKKYDYIIIENDMFLYKKIYENYLIKSKFIFHLHNDIGTYDKPVELSKFISKTSWKVIVVSNYLKKSFIEKTKCSNIEVFNNVVDYNSFYPYRQNEIIELRKKYCFNKNDVIILFCGRLDSEKGCLELLNVFLKIIKKNSNAKMLIVGSGSKIIKSKYENKIDLICKKYKDNIVHINYISNDKMNEIYNISNIVVIPTICEEAFGLVTVESMLCAKPLIVTNSGTLTDFISNKDNIVNRNNFDKEMYQKLDKMINDSAMQREFGKRNRSFMISKIKFDSKNYCKNLFKIITKENER